MTADDKNAWVSWYAHKAFVDFGSLEVEEIGVMTQIINLIYIKSGPVDYDPKYISKHCGVGPARCQKIILSLLQKEKIFLTECGRISQKKCEKEIKNSRERRENAAKNGQKGAKTRWGNKQDQQDSNGGAIIPANGITPHHNHNTVINTNHPSTSEPRATPEPPAIGTGVGVFKSGEGFGVSAPAFSIQRHLTDAGILAAKQAAQGWDIYALMRTYDEGVHNGKRQAPTYPDKAFAAWCARYTKGRKP